MRGMIGIDDADDDDDEEEEEDEDMISFHSFFCRQFFVLSGELIAGDQQISKIG